MKRFAQFAVLLSLAGLVSGCATTSGYFVDRGRDAADIFTCTIGTGAGVKARVGPLQQGFFVNRDRAGLRGGMFFSQFTTDSNRLREDSYPYSQGKDILDNRIYADDHFDPVGEPIRKDYCARSHFPFWSHVVCPSERAYYYTQFELAVGLGGTVRLGFNPGELLDFVLGWTTIDLYRDDIEQGKLPETPEALIELLAETDKEYISAPRLAYLAYDRLGAMGTSAFSALVAHAEDSRYAWRVFQLSTINRTTVGDTCVSILRRQVQPRAIGKGGPDYVPYRDVHKWWRQHEGKSLREIRRKALNWTIDELKGSNRDTSHRDRLLRELQKELEQIESHRKSNQGIQRTR